MSRTRLNGEIRYPEVRVIGSSGEQLGIMSSRDAQLLARDQGVDLVEIAANANPPVVKIIDWGKYQYQKMKEQEKAVRRDANAAAALGEMIEKRNRVESILSAADMNPEELAEASREMEEAENRMNNNEMIRTLKEKRKDF